MPNTIQNLIKSAGPPTKIAKALNLSIPTIGSWTTTGHIPWKHLTKVFDLAGTDPKDYPGTDVESMDSTHRATLFDILTTRALKRGDVSPITQ